MTKEEENNLRILETRVRQLILSYKDLEAKNQELLEKMALQVESMSKLQAENVALKKQYDTLKTAKVLEVSGEDVRDVRKRLNGLVKEVDRCIALLNV